MLRRLEQLALGTWGPLDVGLCNPESVSRRLTLPETAACASGLRAGVIPQRWTTPSHPSAILAVNDTDTSLILLAGPLHAASHDTSSMPHCQRDRLGPREERH
jgi:hypothetical protein